MKDLLCLFEINQENADKVIHLLNVALFYLKTPQVYEPNEALTQWRTSASSTFVMGVIIAVAICIYYSQPSSHLGVSRIKIEGSNLSNRLSLKDSDTQENTDDSAINGTESSEVMISKSSEIDFITVNGKSTSGLKI